MISSPAQHCSKASHTILLGQSVIIHPRGTLEVFSPECIIDGSRATSLVGGCASPVNHVASPIDGRPLLPPPSVATPSEPSVYTPTSCAAHATITIGVDMNVVDIEGAEAGGLCI